MKLANPFHAWFVGVTQLALVALKLLGVFTCSWWWILSPIWMDTGLALVVTVVFLLTFRSK